MERKEFESQGQLNDATYNALGKIVINFSQLLHALEFCAARYVAGLDTKTGRLLEAVLGDRTATPIVSAFFSVFYKNWEDTMSENDGKIMKALHSEINAVVEKRNRLMHESWWYTSVGGEQGPHELSRQRVRAHGKGVEYVHTVESPEGLNAFASDVERLAIIVSRILGYGRDGQVGPELYTRLSIENGKVTVRPLA